ncbi:MAG TPA: septation protein SepH [Mycobacteriales bacterium]|nr:septation protein SepH [Mycobacteriales bacterium]
MRQLHVVSLSEDGRSVLLATSKDASRGGFRVVLDDKLAAALRGDLPRPGERTARTSTLTPKEIQSRLRAGESPEQIAADAQVPVAMVDRFSGPVLSERERIVDSARAATLVRGRLGASLLPLGEAVDLHLSQTLGLRGATVDWTARRQEDNSWLVEVSFLARGRIRTGSWRYDPFTKQVAPSDAVSAGLGHVDEEALRPRRAPARTRVTKKAVARPKKKAPRAKKAAPVKKAAPAKTAAPAKKAAPVKKAAPAKTAAPAKKAAPVKKAAPAKKAAPVQKAAPVKKARRLTVVPTPPPRTPPQLQPRTAKGRAEVPSWAEVLLSTGPPEDAGRSG